MEDYMICVENKERDKNNRLRLGRSMDDPTRHSEPQGFEF